MNRKWKQESDESDLKEIFKQAAEIAQQVPENMQEAAFNRVLDLLTNSAQEDQTRAGGIRFFRIGT
jgi:hypothetical protein